MNDNWMRMEYNVRFLKTEKAMFLRKGVFDSKIQEKIINVSEAEIFIIFQNKTLILYSHIYTPFKHLVQSYCIVEDSQSICTSAL